MKKRIVSLLAVLALCLTMLPMAAFAVDPFENYEVGDTVTLDNKEFTYLGDITETGLSVSEWTVAESGAAGIAKAGKGYVSYSVEDGVAYITVNDTTISAMSEEAFEGYGIQVDGYDASIHGIGTNVIEAKGTAIEVVGCLTLTGEFQRIAGENTGIVCLQVWGDEAEGGDAMINANVGEIIGTENVGIYVQSNLIINGKLGDVSGGTAFYTGEGLTSDNVKESSLTINGTINYVKGYMGDGISGRGNVTIGKEAAIGKIEAAVNGIYVDCITNDEGVLLSEASLNILGTVGPIRASQETDDGLVRSGICVLGGDVVIAEGAVVESIYGDTYGVWADGGQLVQKGSVPGGIAGGDMAIKEWPSDWAYDEVMHAIDQGLVPAEFQCKFTQAATRAEYAALATLLYEAVSGTPIELTEEEKAPFTDTTDENVAKMCKVGVVNGMGDGTFAPDAQLTREQAAAMLSRLAESLKKPLAAAEPAFNDNGKISDWAYDAVGQVQAVEIMKGMGDGTFAPQGDYTREQSILTMDRLFHIVTMDNVEE